MLSMGQIIGLVVGGGCLLLIFALGCVLFSGRGAGLIAGFNTMTTEGKAKYNRKALCRAMGIYVICADLALGAAAWAGSAGKTGLSVALIIAIVVSVLPFLIYISGSKRFRG